MEGVLRLPAVGSKRNLTNKVGHTGVIHVCCMLDVCVMCVWYGLCVLCMCVMLCVCVNGESAETAGRGQQTVPQQHSGSYGGHTCVLYVICVCDVCVVWVMCV